MILETLHYAEVKHAIRVRSFREMQSFRAEAAGAARMCRRGGHENATIIDARREQDLIRAGALIAAPAEDFRAPVRLRLTVSGGRSGQRPRAASGSAAQPGQAGARMTR
jgi:hypothetical protein